MRGAWVDVDLDAVAHNVTELRRLTAPAPLCAVVKADGYGHGAVEVSRAALAAGAEALAVAMVAEGVELRAAGIEAPVLVLAEVPDEAIDSLVSHALQPTVYTCGAVNRLSAAAVRAGSSDPLPVHLKVDTGMHRVGAAAADTVRIAEAIVRAPAVTLASVWTHCAVADDPGDPYTAEQLLRFEGVVAELRLAGIDPPVLHAANSATAIAHPDGRLGMTRCGIAVYGIAPSPALAGIVDLRPALSLRAQVSFVKTVAAGERLSYGRRYRCDGDSVIATVPVGYADGVRRQRAEESIGGEVLVGGRRRPIAGTITMDQLLVDCGDDTSVEVGDEVVLIGGQGDESIAAQEWADRLDTIAYEVVCGISPRVPRRYSGRSARPAS